MLLFVVFGLGAVLISPLMLVLRCPERCQPVVRALWRPLLWIFELTGLVRIEADDFSAVKGSVVVANHPSLIDVMIIVSKLPKTLYVARKSLRKNPWLTAMIDCSALPSSSELPEEAEKYLRKGWNVVIFPEGTRTPLDGRYPPLHRGAAQLSLRTHAPVVGVRLDFSRRILAKHQSIADLGTETVRIRLENRGQIAMTKDVSNLHSAAIALTALIAKCIQAKNF